MSPIGDAPRWNMLDFGCKSSVNILARRLLSLPTMNTNGKQRGTSQREDITSERETKQALRSSFKNVKIGISRLISLGGCPEITAWMLEDCEISVRDDVPSANSPLPGVNDVIYVDMKSHRPDKRFSKLFAGARRASMIVNIDQKLGT